jgi:hypothetical protein
MYDAHGKDAFGMYAAIFRERPYNTLDWGMYNEVYLQIRDEERVEDALPTITEHRKK